MKTINGRHTSCKMCSALKYLVELIFGLRATRQKQMDFSTKQIPIIIGTIRMCYINETKKEPLHTLVHTCVTR